MEKATQILQTQNLSIGYHGKKGNIIVGSDINISLMPGKLVSLVGANGIGKSTLLRTLTGLHKPVSGNVLLYGKNISDYRPLEVAKNISLVLTEKLPPGNLTVFELIAIGRQPYTNWIGKLSDDDIVKVNLAMELTQTSFLAGKKHYEISDGQLQKVMIARALAQDTPIIVLDEPTTHLDLMHKVMLFQLLTTLAHETNKCILFSTHDIEMAIELSDEMILMSPEKIIQDSPQNLMSRDAFNNLFPDETISFDPGKVKFVFKKQ
ncbi:MAG TPA: ABC transporter ATP-binding protein [Flavobacterium sp.]|nr:ABC transporter ATP-binding protein [Flavobacterium sp.]